MDAQHLYRKVLHLSCHITLLANPPENEAKYWCTLIIFAATACRFIEDKTWQDLEGKHGCRSRTGGGLARRAAGAAKTKAKEEAG